jgi:hypothetical protein
VHLPLDLPWEEDGGREAARIALALMAKTAFLGAERAVLHPPAACLGEIRCLRLLDAFLRVWSGNGRDARHLFLENTRENDLASLVPHFRRLGVRVCLDFGHMLAYNQAETLLGALPEFPAPAMVHWSAPEGPGGSGHGSLALLGPAEIRLAGRLLGLLPPCAEDTVMVLELFAWEAVEESLPLLASWIRASRGRRR